MEDSTFTKIIQGKTPSYKIYEDELTIAFLDIHPTRYGHTLVVSKKQVDQYIDLPDEDYLALWVTVKKVATKLRTVVQKERVGIVVKGVDIPHAHVHLIPFDNGESLSKDETSPTLAVEELTQLAEKLKF